MKIQKKHVLVSALVLALGAAVYLNWHFTGTPLISQTAKELGAATYVNKDAKATVDEAQSSKKLTPDEKIAKARLERTQAQDKAMDEAKNIISLSDSSDDAREEAVEIAGEIEKRILAQSNVENILSAKGYEQVLCYIADGGCTVTVTEDEMKDDAPLIIKDVVMSQTSLQFNDIVIVKI